MKFTFTKLFLILITCLLTLSCSEYAKVLKSGTAPQKYRKAMEYVKLEKYQRALALFRDIDLLFAHTEQADSVAFYSGLCYFKIGDFNSSGEKFDQFRENFTHSPFLEEAEYYFAKGFYYMSPDPENDQGYTYRAIRAISEYLERYPNSQKKEALTANLAEMHQKLFDKSYLNARLYYDIGYYNSAVTALKNAILEFPESNHREELAFLIVSAQCKFARNSLAHLQRQRYLDTQNAYLNFIAEYPESEYRDEADKFAQEAETFLLKYKEKHPDGTQIENTEVKENSNNTVPIATSTMKQAIETNDSQRKKRTRKKEKTEQTSAAASEETVNESSNASNTETSEQDNKRTRKKAERIKKQIEKKNNNSPGNLNTGTIQPEM